MRKWTTVLFCALAALALGAGVAGCSDEVEKGLKKLEQAAATNNKALNRKMAKVPIGASIASAKKRLGQPDSYESTENGAGKFETLYYGQWRLVFRDGTLKSKNKF